MRLEGPHHITMITPDAQRNVDFYAGVLGLRMVKKTVNFDQPDAYHLYFGDETGAPGSILTWFEFPGATPGRAGAGMIHTLQLAVAGPAALDFWEQRLRGHGYASERVTATLGNATDALRLRDDDGLQLELLRSDPAQPPLRAVHPEIPAEHAILGIEGARAYGTEVGGVDFAAALLTETLGFERLGGGAYLLRGSERHVHWAYDPPPEAHGLQGAGTVHHIAFACRDEDHLSWQARVRDAGGHVTDVRDRDYFKSIYFREPRGVLFEIATLSPGFAVDEDPDRLGEALRLPSQHEHLRAELERRLRPVVNPRAAAREAGAV